MDKCNECIHAEMCKWEDELEQRGCDFFDESKYIDYNEFVDGFAKGVEAVKEGYIDQIRKEIEDCDCIQNSNESDYTKEQAKLSAYEHIREIICGKEQK